MNGIIDEIMQLWSRRNNQNNHKIRTNELFFLNIRRFSWKRWLDPLHWSSRGGADRSSEWHETDGHRLGAGWPDPGRAGGGGLLANKRGSSGYMTGSAGSSQAAVAPSQVYDMMESGCSSS